MDKTEAEDTMANGKAVRPSKKQRELLTFIENFIAEHGYSPSYREIMNGCNYTSVATVSLHVNNLIKRGHIRKRDRSARSLEVVKNADVGTPAKQENWLVQEVEKLFKEVEQTTEMVPEKIQDLKVLVQSMRILGLAEPARLAEERVRVLEETPPPQPDDPDQ